MLFRGRIGSSLVAGPLVADRTLVAQVSLNLGAGTQGLWLSLVARGARAIGLGGGATAACRKEPPAEASAQRVLPKEPQNE